MTHPDGLPIAATPFTDEAGNSCSSPCPRDLERRARTAEAKVAELERLVAWLRRAEFHKLYQPHLNSPVFITAEEVEQHLASSPTPEWKTPHDNS
jgi:hypothetical protein